MCDNPTDEEMAILDTALAGFDSKMERAVRRVTIDQVDMLAEFYLSARAGKVRRHPED